MVRPRVFPLMITLHMFLSGLPGLRYLCTSVEDLAATETDKFDAVVASEVIEHVDNQEMFVSICSR